MSPRLPAQVSDAAAALAARHSKVFLAALVLDREADVARLEGELARLRAVAPAVDLSGPPLLRVVVPVLITSPLNGSQGGWQGPSVKRRKVREAVTLELARASARHAPPGALTGATFAHGQWLLAAHPRLSVHLERRASRQLDHDNMAAGCKSVVDAVAAWLGTTDAPSGPLRVSYAQVAHRRHAAQPDLVIELRGLP